MAFPAGKTRVQYIADGVRKEFNIPFSFFAIDEIEVWVNMVKYGFFTVSTNGKDPFTGGAVTLREPPGKARVVTVGRRTSAVRTTDFSPSGPFRADALDLDLDRLTALAQDILDRLDRTVHRHSQSRATASLIMPDPVPGDLLGFGNEGQLAALPAARAGVAPLATTDRAGLVELATPAEVVTGTDNTRAMTPRDFKAERLHRKHIFTQSGSWQAPSGVTRVRVTASGGGGGGSGYGDTKSTAAGYGGTTYVSMDGHIDFAAPGGIGGHGSRHGQPYGTGGNFRNYIGATYRTGQKYLKILESQFIGGGGSAGGLPGSGLSLKHAWASQPGQNGSLLVTYCAISPYYPIRFTIGAGGRGATKASANTSGGGNGVPGYVIIEY